MEAATPYIVLAALATFAGPALTQAGKVWPWVDRFSTLVNGGLGLIFAFVCWWVFDDAHSRQTLASMIVLALGGSQTGAMGYTIGRRARQALRPPVRPSGREPGR